MPPARDMTRWIQNADGSYARAYGGASGGEVDATEGALELAADSGIDLSEVEGTGAGGRITKADVEDHIEDDE